MAKVQRAKDGRLFVLVGARARSFVPAQRHYPLGPTSLKAGDTVVVEPAPQGVALVNGEPWSTDQHRDQNLELYKGVVTPEKV